MQQNYSTDKPWNVMLEGKAFMINVEYMKWIIIMRT